MLLLEHIQAGTLLEIGLAFESKVGCSLHACYCNISCVHEVVGVAAARSARTAVSGRVLVASSEASASPYES